MSTCKEPGCYAWTDEDVCTLHRAKKAEARVAELEALNKRLALHLAKFLPEPADSVSTAEGSTPLCGDAECLQFDCSTCIEVSAIRRRLDEWRVDFGYRHALSEGAVEELADKLDEFLRAVPTGCVAEEKDR